MGEGEGGRLMWMRSRFVRREGGGRGVERVWVVGHEGKFEIEGTECGCEEISQEEQDPMRIDISA